MAPAHPPKEAHPSAANARGAVSDEQSADVRTASGSEGSSNLKLPEHSAKRSSWYNRTWPRQKAAPITQVAKESNSSASATASDVASSVTRSAVSKAKKSPSERLTLGDTQPRRSSVAQATTTKVNAVSQTSVPSRTNSVLSTQKSDLKDSEDVKTQADVKADEKRQDANVKSVPQPEKGKDSSQEDATAPPANGSVGWLGWFLGSSSESESRSAGPRTLRSTDSPSQPPESSTQTSADTSVPPPLPAQSPPTPTKRSWIQMWSGGSTKEGTTATEDPLVDTDPGGSVEAVLPDTKAPAPPAEVVPPNFSGDGSKTAGWVFWSRDRKANASTTISNEQHVGEIAVSDTPSQKRPRRTSFSLQDNKIHPPPESQQAVAKARGTQGVKESPTPPSKDSRAGTPTPTPTRSISEAGKESVVTPSSAKFPPLDVTASKSLQASAPNILLPPFYETFPQQESAGLLRSLGRLLSYNRSLENDHLHRVKDVPKIKSALAIGVHGYFPAPFFRTVLGQPTGTSIKFADLAAKAIRKWTESRGYSCEVKTAALEGEGRIAERVDLLWKLLLNWIDEIRKADVIMVACHSQGVPVAMMLVAKLVSFGCVNSARVSICAMAGVSLGPFPDYKTRWMNGTAGELFEFSNPSSVVSKDYITAVEIVLKFGVRVVYVGSMDDQLVSLESSTFAPISHPHIYRAVFVDGRIHAPNFLVHLVGFALKLRNLGIQDHGLIREVSTPLAGSLYTGEGHSRIYEADVVYDLAVAFTLETNSLRDTPLSQKLGPNPPSANPYILPWAVRGILEEDLVKSDLRDEARELLRQFDEWKPTTKVLKDVKFRLEGIRSKL